MNTDKFFIKSESMIVYIISKLVKNLTDRKIDFSPNYLFSARTLGLAKNEVFTNTEKEI